MNNLDLEIQILDEQRQMRNLANAVKLADSFSLLFVRCNQRPRQKEIIDELKGKLDGYNVKVILLEHQVEHLLDELRERLGDEKPDAIFVYGLESSFPKADEAAESKFVVTLNHSRNSFKKVLDCPLVLFLPEYALSAIYHGATDFYSIRSGVYLFSAKAEETEQLILMHASQTFWDSEGLLFEEKQNKIKTIKELLAEYQSLPNLQRNLEKEIRLKEKLAELYHISDEYSKAIKLYEEIIAYARKGDDLAFLSFNLASLATIYQELKRYKESIKLFNESLVINENTYGKKHINYGATLNNLAIVYKNQGDYNKALELYNESLQIAEEFEGTRSPHYAMALSNLAAIYDAQGRYVEAINLYEKVLEIDSEINITEHPDHALHLFNLSVVYYQQQKYQKALASAKKAYVIYRKTLGENHSDTKITKGAIEKFQTMLKEKSSLLVPYKN